ncbi:hypothetical protein ACN22W_29095 [Burkholderia theae]|uniref:hypothetical protein n=1 Tax=Burkholderia theae TaxID=3143496 RepID=UPI003AFAE626
MILEISAGLISHSEITGMAALLRCGKSWVTGVAGMRGGNRLNLPVFKKDSKALKNANRASRKI